MEGDLTTVLAEVTRVAPSLHAAGTFSAVTLAALVRHATAAPVRHSAETGSGASTLLFSHISADHIVFAIDNETGSITSIEHSPLLRREAVTFVEGPTQLTLPHHTFTERLQLALIDGPHGYPFPDLEYDYFYPQLDPGALLVIDDIHIPTITHLFDFVRADDMFDLQEVVETTAFFRRTEAATFPTDRDGWWMQRYNAKAFDGAEMTPVAEVDSPHATGLVTPLGLDWFGPVRDPLRATSLAINVGEELKLAGWALDTGRRCPAAAVDLVLDGTRYRSGVGLPRPDVAAAYGDAAYRLSGFAGRLPAGALTPGPHQLELRVVLAGHGLDVTAARLLFDVV